MGPLLHRNGLALRIHFQETPRDLQIALGYAIAVGTVLLYFGVGTFLAVFLVFIIPGYLFVAMLFPSDGEIDWIERLGLSFGLSIGIVPLIALALNFTPFNARLEPLVVAIVLFSLLMGLQAYRRRMNLPVSHRLSASLEVALPRWAGQSVLDRSITVVLGAGLVVSASFLIYVGTMQRPTQGYTEFYLYGVAGNASGYPKCLDVFGSSVVVLGVVNHEQTEMNYTVRIDLVGVNLFYNTSAGVNESIEVNRTSKSMFNLTLDAEKEWRLPYAISIGAAGTWEVEFTLFKERDFLAPYRELHLFARVPCG